MWNRLLRIILGMVFLGVSSLACNIGDELRPCTYDIDPIFKTYYTSNGGLEILGCPLTPILSQNGKYYQYTPFVLMVYDPNAPSSSQYYFSDLGKQLNLEEKPVDPDTPGTHEVYSSFKNMYRQLGGARGVGSPITGIKIDPDYGRIYQCFENMCFEQKIQDPEGRVGLLPLGAMKCGDACKYDGPSLMPVLYSPDDVDIVANRLGVQLVGIRLSEGYFSPEDGAEEWIFENVVFYKDPTKVGGFGLRPLPLLLGLQPDPLETISTDTSFSFYVVEGELGYNVPKVLWDYVTQHSGFEYLGAPVTRYQKVGDNLYRQCLENICLHHYLDELIENPVQPMALGYHYQKMLQEVDALESGLNSYGGLQMTVWEAYPVLPAENTQIISALIIDAQTPLPNIEMALTVTIPGGDSRTYYLPPTDLDGRTSVELDPIRVLNGTYVEYELCILNLVGANKCVSDHFLVWDTP